MARPEVSRDLTGITISHRPPHYFLSVRFRAFPRVAATCLECCTDVVQYIDPRDRLRRRKDDTPGVAARRSPAATVKSTIWSPHSQWRITFHGGHRPPLLYVTSMYYLYLTRLHCRMKFVTCVSVFMQGVSHRVTFLPANSESIKQCIKKKQYYNILCIFFTRG